MNKWLCVIMLLCGCSERERAAHTPPPTHRIKLKHQAVEQRMGFDPFDRNILRQRTETVYYFASDAGYRI